MTLEKFGKFIDVGDVLGAILAIETIEDLDETHISLFLTTPLSYAAMKNQTSVVQELIKRGANIHIEDYEDWQPIHYAAQSGDLDIIRILLDAGANIEALTERGLTPLHLAAGANDVQACDLLIRCGSAVAIPDADGWHPLHQAAFLGNLDMCALLLAHGGKLDAKTWGNPESETPYNMAKMKEFQHICDFFDKWQMENNK